MTSKPRLPLSAREKRTKEEIEFLVTKMIEDVAYYNRATKRLEDQTGYTTELSNYYRGMADGVRQAATRVYQSEFEFEVEGPRP